MMDADEIDVLALNEDRTSSPHGFASGSAHARSLRFG
jgi:hypothetical protein